MRRIDDLEVARTEVRAMIDDLDQIFYPDNPEDARYFADQHGARPLDLDVFPEGWL